MILLLLVLAADVAWTAPARPVEPYRLIENFTGRLGGRADRAGGITATIVTNGEQKVGLAAARLDYRLGHRQGRAQYLIEPAIPLPGPGTLRVWLHGDGSSNIVRFALWHGRRVVAATGEARFEDTRDEWGEPVVVDFTGWRELTLDARKLPADRALGWRGLSVEGGRRDDAHVGGTLLLDDLRLYGPAAAGAPATMKAGLAGARDIRDARGIAISVDLRNFGVEPLSAKVRLSLTDRDDTSAADVDRTIRVGAGESGETLIPVAPEDPARYVPPYRLKGDVLCAELPEDAGRFERALPVANGYVLFEPFADVSGAWLARPAMEPNTSERELYRYTAEAQTNLAVTRVLVEPRPPGVGPGDWPPAGTALRVAFAGEGGVYNLLPATGRYLPGDALRLGCWVRGTGSNTVLSITVHDYSDMAGYFAGDWQRVRESIDLARLDFEGWRYVEVDLPGNGVGTHLPRGSTGGLDYPMELAAFQVRAAARHLPFTPGHVEIGPVFVLTQQRAAANLAVFAGYDDADRFWAADRNAWCVLQNGRLDRGSRLTLNWELTSRDGTVLGQGRRSEELAAGEARTIPLDLSACAAAARTAPAPFLLKTTVASPDDGSLIVERTLALARPDSRGLHAGFEEERAYEPFKAIGVDTEGQARVSTTTAQAHSGRRSLPLAWRRDKGGEAGVSIDPALPGIPVRVSLWVWGDGSGARLRPVIGDRNGARRGVAGGQWDLFPAFLAGAAGREGVTVDWSGWRQLDFLLPAIPASWAEEARVLPFVPSYPLGLHLVVEGAGATADKGTLYVDDVTVETHLPPGERVGARLRTGGEVNLVPAGTPLEVDVWNLGLDTPRTLRLGGGAFDWRGQRVAGGETGLTLGPGESRTVTLAPACPPGAFVWQAELGEGTGVVARLAADLVVADPVALLGDTWRDALLEDWRLREAVASRFQVVNEDWDWVEPHPGNLQVMTIKGRAAAAKSRGGDPYLLLGYSAYWAAGEGFEGFRSGVFGRRARDVGHGVDVFMPPERLDDWDNYVRGVMRGAAGSVSGWVVWDNPDGTGPLAVKPDKFAAMLASCDRWRRQYGPDKALLVGGLQRDTAIPYLQALARVDSNILDRVSGVHVRLDLGRLSPEDANVVRYVRDLRAYWGTPGGREPQIVMTDVDWAVERGAEGLGPFDQAAYGARAGLLLAAYGVHPVPLLVNGDFERYGLGLAYRESRACPPYQSALPALRLKPAWLGLARLRQRLAGLAFVGRVAVPDRRADLTWGAVYKRADGAPVVAVWRNDESGRVSFEGTGLGVAEAEDLFGSTVTPGEGGYAVGRVPVWFVLKAGDEPALEALGRLRVRDEGGPATWMQRPLAAFTPATGARWGYRQTGGQAAAVTGRAYDGETVTRAGLAFGAGGTERFEVPVPAGAGLVLRREFALGPTGETAEVSVNGQPVGTWNLGPGDGDLSRGICEAVWVVEPAQVGGAVAGVELRYPAGGRTTRWTVFEYRGGAFPLAAVGAVHVEQNVARPRPGRNVVGGPLRIGETRHAEGVGVFAQSLMEIALNRQFGRFKATVGVDAAAEGRGSVVFEVHGDGRKLWSSPVMSGLDVARPVDVAVKDVDRLRLVVTDAGDGNRFDAADWCEAGLTRP